MTDRLTLCVCVLCLGGLRTIDAVIPFFERIINTVPEVVPKVKLAFNVEIDKGTGCL